MNWGRVLWESPRGGSRKCRLECQAHSQRKYYLLMVTSCFPLLSPNINAILREQRRKKECQDDSVSNLEGPLRVEQSYYALGVEEVPISSDLNPRNIPATGIEILLACSLELSALFTTLYHSTSAISIVETYSLNPTRWLPGSGWPTLTFGRSKAFRPHFTLSRRPCPLSNGACDWGTHARPEPTESVKATALELLDRCRKGISSMMLLLSISKRPLIC